MGGRLPEYKQHFVFLDGFRGIAALLVGGLHASQIFSLSYKPAHAYLAVDFFFCLSGFVVAYAYDEKLEGGDALILRAVSHVQKLPHLPSTVFPALPALGILAAAASAYVIMKLYDEPVRRWLTARRGVAT